MIHLEVATECMADNLFLGYNWTEAMVFLTDHLFLHTVLGQVECLFHYLFDWWFTLSQEYLTSMKKPFSVEAGLCGPSHIRPARKPTCQVDSKTAINIQILYIIMEILTTVKKSVYLYSDILPQPFRNSNRFYHKH